MAFSDILKEYNFSDIKNFIYSRKDKDVEDALSATKSATIEGIVAGGAQNPQCPYQQAPSFHRSEHLLQEPSHSLLHRTRQNAFRGP